MKIVYLTDQIYLTGGAEKILIQKLNYWVEFYGYEVKLITTNQEGKKPFYPLNKQVELIDLDINYIEGVSFFSPYNFLKLPKHILKLNKELKKFKPDAIFVISRSFVRFIAPIVARKYAIYNEYHTSYYGGHLGYVNSSFVKKLKFKLVKRVTKFIESFYTKIIFLNQEEYDHFKLENSVIIPNFFDEIEFDTEVEKKNKIITLGRLCYQKGYDLLIDAWVIVDAKVQGWELNIYGNGEDQEKLSNQINSKNFKNPLYLNAAIDNINEKLSEAAFYVMSSRFETFPMVLLEALSNKLPVVSFDCPTGPRSMVIDGEDAILAKPNDVEDLAKKILILINDIKLRNTMSDKAKINVTRFSPSYVMNLWDELIRENKRK